MSLYAHVISSLFESLEHQAAEEQKVLREKALHLGWTPKEAASIEVSHVNGALHASVGEDGHLPEYGDAGQPPRSVVRAFNAVAHHKVNNDLEADLWGRVGHLL